MPSGMIGTLGMGRPPAAGAAPTDLALAAVQSTGLTTPDPVLLQKTLRRFVEQGLRACAIEASSIGIEEQRLAGTNITCCYFHQLHAGPPGLPRHHGGLLAVQAPVVCLAGLAGCGHQPGRPAGCGVGADPGRVLDVWTTSLRQNARLQARDIRYESQGVCFEVVEGDASPCCKPNSWVRTTCPICWVSWLPCAVWVFPLLVAVRVCARLHPVPGRMECLGERRVRRWWWSTMPTPLTHWRRP
jgi:hypothetical protein